MNPDDLKEQIDRFLASPTAKQICQRYHADPKDAQGELYLKLINRQPARGVRNFGGWLHVTCIGLLKNYLRREHLTLV